MASLLQGEVAYRRGDIDVALVCLERAWRIGGRNVLMADRLIDLLTQQGRFQDAQRYVMEMRDYLSVSSEFFDRAVPYYARSGETQEALQLAEDWIKRQPKDPFAHLRLGRVLLILAEKAEPGERAKLLDRAEQGFAGRSS
jgi:tetratricopeptide (TPR) repeat protein